MSPHNPLGPVCLGPVGPGGGLPGHGLLRHGVVPLGAASVSLGSASHGGARPRHGTAGRGRAMVRFARARLAQARFGSASARLASAWQGSARLGSPWQGEPAARRPLARSGGAAARQALAPHGSARHGFIYRFEFGRAARGLARRGQPGLGIGAALAGRGTARRGVDSLIDLHTARRGSGEARLAPAWPDRVRQGEGWGGAWSAGAWPGRVRHGVDSLIDFNSARLAGASVRRGGAAARHGTACRGWPSCGSARRGWPWMGTAGRGDGRDLARLGVGTASHGMARHASARLGGARPGAAGHGRGQRISGALTSTTATLESEQMARKATAKKADAAEEAPRTPRSAKVVPIGPVGNAGAGSIDLSRPYSVALTIEGTADLLFHRWQTEAVEAVANAGKNTKQKKTDNVEAYVWRNEAGDICLPAEYLRRAIVEAAKFRQDPRSPRKSAMDLVNASIITLEPLATLGKTAWDFLDRRRVRVQRQGITRTRPAIASGWQASFSFGVLVPEYIDPVFFRELLRVAGQLIGVGDFRPSYGRFDVVKFETVTNLS